MKKHFLLILFFTFLLSGYCVCAPSQGTITISPAHPTPGQEVTVTWKLNNTTPLQITGKIIWYLGSYPLNDPAIITLRAGLSEGGTFTFMPFPGWNQISVVFQNTQLTWNPPKPPLLEWTDPSGSPKVQPGAGSAFDNIPTDKVFPATVSIGFNDVSTSIPANPIGLSPALRKQLLADYSPLLLYSNDHGLEEQYPPIDADTFVQGSSLIKKCKKSNVLVIPNSTLQKVSSVPEILNPDGISYEGTILTSATPANLYLDPDQASQQGATWTFDVGGNLQGKNIGLYGRAILVDLSNLSITDPALPTASLLARYKCQHLQRCPAQVVKLEYWQLFGYSADYYGSSLLEKEINHEGDWCGVQMYIDLDWIKTSPERAILWVVHYLHGKQVGFNMAMANPIETLVTVPKRSANDNAYTYPAQEVQGPNYGDSVEIPIKVLETWIPFGGPDLDQQLSQAQNNVLRLANEGPINFKPEIFSSSGHPGPSRLIISYRHPVVYVEWGGHEFWPTDWWTIVGASKHNGTGIYSYFGDSATDITPNSIAARLIIPPDVQIVSLFSGYWGGPQSNNGPPPGPPLHCEYFMDSAANPNLYNALHAGEAVDPASVEAGQIGGPMSKCGGNRPY